MKLRKTSSLSWVGDEQTMMTQIQEARQDFDFVIFQNGLESTTKKVV